jgi:hypothetical protein
MTESYETLETIVARTVAERVPSEIQALAAAVEALHAPGTAAVIAYGSALRGVAAGETLIDLYVLTDSAAAVSSNPLARLGCRLVAPNVHYAEVPLATATLRAKYAIMPLDLFVQKMTAGVSNPYFWARFAQPCRIVAARDEDVRNTLVAALCEAVRTMIAASLPLGRAGDDALKLWQRGFTETYRTELRPEAGDRAREIVLANAPYYRAVTQAVLGPDWQSSGSPEASAGLWRRRRLAGKILSVLRLVKAAFTFEGGADYLAWKITRHSGLAIEVKPWQRRHPVLGALWLLPGLLRRGAVR